MLDQLYILDTRTTTMSIDIEEYGSVAVIGISGKLNATTTAEVQERVLVVAEKTPFVLLDMSRVTYLSSAGLRMLLLLYRQVREHSGALALTGLSEDVRDIMSITGFLDLFTIYDDRSQALEQLRRAS